MSVQTHAFQLSPVIVALEPSGIKAEQVYLLTNTSNEPAAVQFSVTTRQQRQDGSEVRNAAEALFDVHPKQVVIPSGGTQKVRLKWLGKKAVTREQAYRFIAKQLPIKLSKNKGMSIKMVVAIEAAVYVRPIGKTDTLLPESKKQTMGSTPQKSLQQIQQEADITNTTPEMLNVKSVKVVNTPNGKQLALTVENPADAHIVLNNIQVQITSHGKIILLQGKQLGNMQKQNLLADSTRNFIMPIPMTFDQQQNWTAQIQKTP